MLFNIIKFLVLAFIAAFQIMYIRDPFLNYLSFIVLAGSVIMLLLGMMVPPTPKK